MFAHPFEFTNEVHQYFFQNFLVGEEELSPKETKLRIVFASLRHPYHELHFSMVRVQLLIA